MGSEKDRMSDPGDGDEDIPSDFFDDFTKEDFMEGLSVIDSWDDEDGIGRRREARRINVEALDSVKDLRELIGENKEDTTNREVTVNIKFNDKYKWRKQDLQHGASSSTSMDDFIKPGSRRDPSKTNEAIKKDKDLKVKEYLAKHLDSADDLRPPGTELDDYYDDKSKELKKTSKHIVEEQEERPQRQVSIKERNFKDSHHVSPRRSPRRQSPRRMSPRRYSPRRKHSPRWSPRHSPARQFRPRFSPHKLFRKRFSPPPRRSSPPRRSPRRYTPPRSRAHSPRRRRSSRSPIRRPYISRRSRSPRSRSPQHKDTFLYPNDPQGAPAYPLQTTTYQPEPGQLYAAPVQNEFPGSVPGYPYSQGLAYGTGFPGPYNYSLHPVAPGVLPEPLPLPNINPVPAPPLNVVPAPAMVPAPAVPPVLEQKTPYDALAQLVAEGKISQEDYLKLAPNKGVSSSYMDSKTMHGVMTRCSQAITKLEKLFLPNHLMMNNHIIGAEPKSIESKFCSPLKRQAVIEFNFTKTTGPTLAQQNKQLVESIITTIGLDKVVSRYKKKMRKDVKDAACQTTKPYCDVCEIRDSTKCHEVGTAVDPDYFTTTVHTQVVEHDLVNSKSVFNPSGSVADGAPISIAHLTPAQLVSQLAARAKTLKQSSPAPPPMHQNQFGRRNPGYDYDGRGAGGGGGGQQQYHNYNNYRY